MRVDKEYINKLQRESQEIRDTLVEITSKNGGHLAPNLGVVELTQGIVEVFDLPKDKLLFDVGHQSYVYKLLTGRKEKFKTLRTKGGIGPFSDPKESEFDFFIAGHAGSALSAGAGIAKANPDNKVIVVIGDASIANGHSLEALNNIGGNLKNLIIILNDNEMSIGENVGSLSKFFGKLMISNAYMNIRKDIRSVISKGKVGNQVKNILERIEYSVKQFFLPSSISEVLGYQFLGVIDGHNLEEILKTLTIAKEMEGPVFIHIKTEKGKGYQLAEENKEKFHGISPFNPETGEVEVGGKTYSSIFGSKLVSLAERDSDIYAISAAMVKGTGLGEFQNRFKNRCIDVGIAEGHGVTFSAGLAISGKKPYVAIYSTFFQRALDQLIHDVGLQNLPVRFIVDRAGIVGEDGKTHQGIHDINMFLSMPNFRVLAPSTGKELEEMLEFSKDFQEGPLVIRFPRGKAFEIENKIDCKFKIGKWNEIRKGKKNLYLVTGAMLKEILEIENKLLEKGLDGAIVNCSSIRPLDEDFIFNEFSKYDNIFTFEDGYERGGFGNEVLRFLNEKKMKININIIALDSVAIPHGSRNALLEDYGLRGKKLIERIEGSINGEK
ncbi:1-deoxy-D-xylulose-5-phosphate synthase [Cetobacterium somerae]|uniref:1-deoxy-D-xylulose-5-phosphate synthase n=1 Tax=Cetobacterium sp. NK01 TaxID=2993530 RepID=UPI002116B242|nr:1-deoxy-D-xylulose-5-phosphate synthase [Cetobacterium sp. NK01]MCQ8211750.1 1-deoxy-D-xylulose-5-phosphate synthase [Cetobacterium sp. NK01]